MITPDVEHADDAQGKSPTDAKSRKLLWSPLLWNIAVPNRECLRP
jgi:hypothetical protein